MRVLVLGGTRFIGAQAVRALVRLGHEITVFHRGLTEAELPAPVVHAHGDRRQVSELHDALAAARPELVLDMTAQTEQHALQVVEVFAGRVERLVAISSLDVYRGWERYAGLNPGPAEPIPLAEGALLREIPCPRRHLAPGSDPWWHDYDKRRVEQVLCAADDLALTVLRLPFVHGPDDYRRRVRPTLDQMAETDCIVMLAQVARWRCTRGYVDNVAAAIALAVHDPRAMGQTFNVGDAVAPSHAEWIEAIGRAADWRGQLVIRGTQHRPRTPSEPDYGQHLVLDTSRLRSELGFCEPVSFEEGLTRTVAWDRDQPRSPPLHSALG